MLRGRPPRGTAQPVAAPPARHCAGAQPARVPLCRSARCHTRRPAAAPAPGAPRAAPDPVRSRRRSRPWRAGRTGPARRPPAPALRHSTRLAGIRGSGKIDREVTHVRTRLRQLRIDGRTFVWRAEIRRVQGSGDYCHRCIRLRVWGAGKTSQALQADLLSVAWPAPWGACTTDGAYPASADVRAAISYALRHGWQPERRGGTFVLSEHQHAAGFTLPDFLLTDRLRTPESADPRLRVIHAYGRRHRR
jgi:hypothetical protein